VTRLILATSLCLTLLFGGVANAGTRQQSGPCDGRASDLKPSYGTVIIDRRVRQLEHCIENRWPVPGGFAKLDYIIERESGRFPWAKNPDESGACHFANPYGSCGLAQHLQRYWLGRVHTFLPRSFFPGRWPYVSSLNARANLIVTVRYVRANGWGAWGG